MTFATLFNKTAHMLPLVFVVAANANALPSIELKQLDIAQPVRGCFESNAEGSAYSKAESLLKIQNQKIIGLGTEKTSREWDAKWDAGNIDVEMGGAKFNSSMINQHIDTWNDSTKKERFIEGYSKETGLSKKDAESELSKMINMYEVVKKKNRVYLKSGFEITTGPEISYYVFYTTSIDNKNQSQNVCFLPIVKAAVYNKLDRILVSADTLKGYKFILNYDKTKKEAGQIGTYKNDKETIPISQIDSFALSDYGLLISKK
jgi:hypothetical protein